MKALQCGCTAPWKHGAVCDIEEEVAILTIEYPAF